MLIDGRTVATERQITCDLAIIGAGPAGLTIARELENTKLKIIILETGGEKSKPANESGKQVAPDGYTYDLDKSRGRGIGGSSGLWGLIPGWQARPIDPEDFQKREWIPHSGWPITYDELIPYYEKAHQICKLGPFKYDGEFWLQWEKSKPDFPISTDAIETSIMRHAELTLFSSLKEHLQKLERVTIYLNSRVIDIQSTQSKSQVNCLKVATDAGNQFQVVAKNYVLAAGGIDNARLLLFSNLGNDHDLVGRYFMEHPHVKTGCIKFFNRGIPRQANFYIPHQSSFKQGKETGNKNLFKGIIKLKQEVTASEKLGNCIVFIYPVPEIVLSTGFRSISELYRFQELGITPPKRVISSHYCNALKDSPKIFYQQMRKYLGFKLPPDALIMSVESEQIPNPDSRVVLDDQCDRFGMPIPKLQWKFTDFDLQTIKRTQEIIDRDLRKLNLGYVEQMFGDISPVSQVCGGSHHMGTTRMSSHPKYGVVDSNCRVHGVSNLYVAGSSVFTTGGSSNPTLTVIALAVRLAEELKKIV